MGLESKITRAIISSALRQLEDIAEVDVVIVGAGPSGLTAAYYLSKKGYKTVVFERRLCYGGGIGGGGMLLPRVVFDEKGLDVVREIGIRVEEIGDGLYVADPVELMSRLALKAIEAGAKIILGITVEDVIYRENPLRINGVVINWSAVLLAGLHVDPLFVESRAVIDATGHDAEVLRIVERKVPTQPIKLKGEKSAYTEKSDKLIVEFTGRVIPGLYAAGMAVAALHGLPRMGPIFTGMLLSGRRVAEIVDKDLREGHQ